MDNYEMNNTENVTIEVLLGKISKYTSEEKEQIIRAFEYAASVHKGVLRKSGEPYIIHPLAVAGILADMQADTDTIVAGLLHDTVEDGEGITVEDISHQFNPTVANLVDGVTKINKIQFDNDKAITAQANERKIIESFADDVRIFIIKLADRLHNMRTMEYQTSFKQIEKSRETMELYVPFSYLIGAYSIKRELEDLAFKYLRPDDYMRMNNLINEEVKKSRGALDEVICSVSQLLNSREIPFDIKLRVKNLYGLYRRLEINNNNMIENVHDLFALKLLVENKDLCYLTLGLVHSIYHPMNGRFKDYISNPKTNMYQSLHTTIFGPSGRKIQVQIKTPEMYKINSYGLTAYWEILKNQRTKNAAQQMQDDVKQFQFFKNLDELIKLNVDNEKFNDAVRDTILKDSIYVYTRKGDIIELPKNASVLDFAYKVNQKLGDYMIACKINDKYEDITTQLHNYDSIEIIADENLIGPRRDYTSLATTPDAKRLVKELKKNGYVSK